MKIVEEKLPPGLSYSDDSEPGISRKGAGKGFAYYDSDGALIKSK